MIRVFVYGSLLTGLSNHRVLAGAKLIEAGEKDIHCKMVSLGAYPALIQTSLENSITGELYEVDEEGLQRLDYLEGHPNFYKRIQVDGVWVYFLNREHDINRYTVIDSGDWRAFHKVSTERRKYG